MKFQSLILLKDEIWELAMICLKTSAQFPSTKKTRAIPTIPLIIYFLRSSAKTVGCFSFFYSTLRLRETAQTFTHLHRAQLKFIARR